MEVVFLTNFLTHHQTPFCEEMYEKQGINFHLVVMRSADPEQRKLGYKELNDLYPYVIKTYEGREQEAMELCERADVVIWGSAPEKYTRKRLEQNKLTFVYTERIFKKGRIYALHPAMIRTMYRKYTAKRNKKQYYLCASGYTASDINPYVHTPDKFFKWGYFPETRTYADVNGLLEKKKENSIIWVGRYIDWKHPEVAIEIAKRLKKDGYQFGLNMIGNGVMLEDIKRIVQKEGLEDCVHIMGGVPSDQVRTYMEQAQIHMFTSDRNEGWGAVLNESMNSACAVVANQAIGSVPFLITEGENGYTYKTINELYRHICYLLDHPEDRKLVSQKAYQTITHNWNAEIAAQRLLKLSEDLLTGTIPEYQEGPCAKVYRTVL